MMRRLRYCLYAKHDMPEDPNELSLSGLFEWSTAFKTWGRQGVLFPVITPELLETFDIIHVNYVPRNASYIHAIRDNLGDHSDTKLIANVDFSVGMWNSIEPYQMKRALDECDMVFHVEPFGAARLSDILGRHVWTLPHPVNIEGIRHAKLGLPTMEPITVSCQYHRYKDTWETYHHAMHGLRKEYGVRSALFNYTTRPGGAPSLHSTFDLIYDRMSYTEYLATLAQCYVNLDVVPDATYGRGVVDAAAVGLPTVGWKGTFAMDVLFPELMVENFMDHIEIRDKVEKLLTDPEFASVIAARGIRHSMYFSLENSYKRMVGALEDDGLI